MTYLFNPKDHDGSTPNIGGKGFNLLKIEHLCNVPDWFALTADAFIQFLNFNKLNDLINEKLTALNHDNLVRVSKETQKLIINGTFDPDFKQKIEDFISSRKEEFVSVRSSATDEDGKKHSFAGIHESFLFVKGVDSILQHIRKVWASGYQERALFYRLNNNLPVHPIPMAVIIQTMINAKSSGVVFTVNPINSNVHEMVISSLYGLGEGLVSAGLSSDQVEFNKNSQEFTESISYKETQFKYDEKNLSGIIEEKVELTQQEKLSLSKDEIRELAKAAMTIETFCKKPQDIEFCFDGSGKLFILQTRDITTVTEYGPSAGNPQIWDNSNIIESYSGVTSPMTFSFIREAYAVVYNCFSEVMGIPKETIQKNQVVYQNMLGLFNGQVYYNLPNWYRLVKQFPGYNYNKSFMESMMGVKDTADSDDPEGKQSAFNRYFIELPKLMRLVLGMGRKFIGLKKTVPQFNAHFEKHYSVWDKMDFDLMHPHELMSVYYEMQDKLLRNWRTPIVNDFHVMVFYGILKNCCKKWCGDENGTLQNNLICGEGDIESTIPTRTLMKLAAKIKESPSIVEIFNSHTPEQLLTVIPKNSNAKFIVDTVADYLSKYGFRCINELKLEEPSLLETPEFIYQMLKNYIKMDSELLNIEALKKREEEIRVDAENQAFSKLSFIKKKIFFRVLKQARNGVKNRENMRFARTKIYGQLRLILNSVGKHFTEEDIIEDPQDIYYLTINEVWDFVKGTAVTTKLSELIKLRKKEFTEYKESESNPDDHFTTYGMAYHCNSFKNYEKQPEEPLESGTLKGVGCSPGTLEGTAKVVLSPKDDIELNGEILIAGRTDPGWVPLYPSVSGILIERGSILSHSAIVAREMGIPAIVGIPNLLTTIKDGDKIKMDGTTGIIEIS